MKSQYSLLIFLVSLCSQIAYSQPKLYINELLANNVNNLPGELWSFEDWVEIYNAGEEPVNMGGMYFSGNENEPTQWKIPESNPELTTIQPKSYLLFWFDKLTYLNELHVDLKLRGEGEEIFLFDKDGTTLLDKVSFGKQYPDVSYGRITNGNATWSFFQTPTPNSKNEGKKAVTRILHQPEFSLPAGFYDDKIKVKISSPEKSTKIYYTIDGSEPNRETSIEYKSPIEITATLTLRAQAYKNGFISSLVETNTYFINEPTSLPVVSLTCDPSRLWNEKTGLYATHLSDIERNGHVEFFDTDREKNLELDIGIKLTGRYSTEFPKKSFVLICRGKYGADEIKYPLFKDKPIKEFDGIILRSDPTASKNENPKLTGERIKNELIYQINKEMGNRVDMQAYLPAVLFLNGKYWGLYNIMERKGDEFIKSNFGVKKMDMINGRDGEVIEGDNKHYKEMLGYLNENNIRLDSAYARVKTMMDIENFIDYRIQELYYASNDPNYNIRYWRPKTPEGKWRWLNFDHDSWAPYTDTTLHKHSVDTIAENVKIFGRLLQNEDFRNAFINRLADYLNTVLLPNNIYRLVDEITAVIAEEKPRDRARWEKEMPYVKPGAQVEWVKKFAEKRPEYLVDEIVRKFNLNGIAEVELNINNNLGSIKVNSIEIDSFPWKGIYFNDIPITITAIPKEGHQFKGWTGSDSPSNSITFTLKENISLTAKFE